MSESNTIIIGKPYIEEKSTSINLSGGVRLCANISMKNPNTNKYESRVLYFEYEKRYKNYICEERADAFVVGLLTTAMETGQDIRFETPISERLYYQLTTYYIPLISKFNSKKFQNIKLIGETSNLSIDTMRAVATGCSGGVDSFYTIVRHDEEHMIKNYNLTHLVFASCGTLDDNNDRIEAYYKKNVTIMQSLASEIGCDIIGCYTNLHEFYRFPYYGFCTLYATVYSSVIFAIQKLVGIYYISSGDPITEFTLDLEKAHGHDGSIFDVFTVGCLNTENLTFYPAGTELARIEKEDYISDNTVAQNYLTVCGMENVGAEIKKFKNCGTCPKCLRTIVQLYVQNDLDNFGNVFDLESFYKNKDKRIAKMLAYNKRSYVKETLHVAKNHGVKFGTRVFLWKNFWYKPIVILSHMFSDNKLARKIYYKLNLDYKLHGYRAAKYDAFKENTK